MLTSRSLYLRLLRGKSQAEIKQLIDRVSDFEYQEDTGVGFYEFVSASNGVAEATLIVRKSTYRTIFDPFTEAFEKEENIYFEEIPFSIDPRFSTLEVYSASQNVNILLSEISKLVSFQVVIESLNLHPANLPELLASKGVKHKIIKIRVNNYKPNPGLVGNFTAVVLQNQNANEIIASQKQDISQIGVTVKLSETLTLDLHYSKTGRIQVRYESEDEFTDVFAEIKEILLEGANDA